MKESVVIVNPDGSCNCRYGKLQVPGRGFVCGLTTTHAEMDFSKGVECRKYFGCENCRQNAIREYRYIREITEELPIFPNEYNGAECKTYSFPKY